MDDSELLQAAEDLAQNVSFTVATTTRSTEPIQSARGQLNDANLDEFRPREPARDRAIQRLEKLGFKILHVGRFGTTVTGPATLLQEVIGEPMMLMRQDKSTAVRAARAFAAASGAPAPHELFLAPASSLSIEPHLAPEIDHFVFAPPALWFAAPAATAPQPTYHNLTPALIRKYLNVPGAGADATWDGKGIRIGLIDSGFQIKHPYYTALAPAFSAVASPGGPPGDQDPIGHGTSLPLNVFALSPRVDLIGIRYANAPYQDAVEVAVDQHNVDILSCSWGWDREQSFPVLEATLRSVIKDDGKLVLFASGNGQYAWPSSMPEVISIGGVYADEQGALRASDFASGFQSSLYPNRTVPDVCGLCGLSPKGIYIPMPCPPGSPMDTSFAGGTFPNGDETGAQDGWVVASGTSSAAPQIAGVLALLLQAARQKGTTLKNADAKTALQQTARSVTQGRNAFGFPTSATRPNAAVGWGLTDTAALLTYARAQNWI